MRRVGFLIAFLLLSALLPCLTFAAQINTTAAPSWLSNGLIAHWTMDAKNMTSGRIDDVSGNGNHAYVSQFATSSLAASSSIVTGKVGQALRFQNPYSQTAKVANNIADNVNALTVSFWTRDLLGTHSNTIILAKMRQSAQTCVATSGGVGSWVFSKSSTNTFFFCVLDSNGSSTSARNTTAITDTNWHHVVGVYDGSTVTIYVDGVQGTVSTMSGVVKSESSYPICFNASNTGAGGDCLGSLGTYVMDDVRIHNRALSAAEITELYRMGQGFKANTTPVDFLKTGLVGHWTFDNKDITGGRFNDISGQGNHAYASGTASSTFYTVGKLGQGLNFDGSNDILTLPNTSNFTEDFTALTVSAWVKNDEIELSDSYAYVAKGGFGEASTWTLYKTSGEQWAFTVKNSAPSTVTVVSAGNLNEDYNWHHVVGTWDGSTIRVYVDGVDVSSPAQSQTGSLRNTSMNISIGGNSTGAGERVNGSIDDVRIYNRALSVDEISKLYKQGATGLNANVTQKPMSATSGLVAHYTFDGKNITSGRVDDVSGSGNHANTVSIASSTFYAIGKIGQGVTFDGSNDYIRTQSAISTTGLSSISYSFWMKTTQSGASSIIDTGNSSRFCRLNAALSNKINCSVTTSSTGSATSLTSVNDGRWHHIVYVSNGNNQTLYVDGVSEATTAQTLSTTSGSIFLGNLSNLAAYYAGSLDDVRIYYNRALTASEVTKLYNLGR